MKSFKELGVLPKAGNIRGPKIKVRELLGKNIIVHGQFKLMPSKFGNGKKCLHLQIEYEGKLHIVFTTAHALIDVIQQVKAADGFPFTSVILKQNDRYEFT